ncbi:MAG: FAD-binding oxidoreductase, partial [Hyphomicrobiales bacterium]|nr:FAD-binding oxidoreductase [Hyphomicrobiales bacterium]
MSQNQQAQADTPKDTTADIVVIGAGIAGASLGAMLAANHRVIVLERETRPDYHATGRSAAIFTEIYGNPVIRALTRASRSFFEAPPDGFAAAALWRGIETVMIGTAAQRQKVEAVFAEVSGNAPGVELMSGADYEALVPACRPGVIHSGVRDTRAQELDVAAIHQGFQRLLKTRGGEVVTRAEVTGLVRVNGLWTVEAGADRWRAPVVVNAAGAWAGEVGVMAGAVPIAIAPLRRSVCVVDAPAGVDPGGWPMSVDVDEQFYFKPESGRLLCSPADETPSLPCDAQPEELDLAIAIDRIQKVIDLPVSRYASKWAGLRTFAPDRTPLVGFDPLASGFFWFAGQGGYGIQTAPAMAETGAALIDGSELPEHIVAEGVVEEDLAPGRFLADLAESA